MNSDESSHLTSNFVPLVPFNSTDPNGGDSLTGNLNIYYEVKIVRQRHVSEMVADFIQQSGDIAWILTSTALVLLMIPGVG